LGHYALDCPDRLLKLQETQESENGDTQQADALMMHELVYINEKNVQRKALEENSDFKDMWYLDNGASNHMTGNLEYFSKIDKTVTGKVRFGDDSRIDIKGKGSIPFVSKNGDSKLLEDVYYIPDLRSNIISLGQATEAGCDVRMRKGYLTLFDREGELLIWANRARNRLYKVTLEVKQNKCLQLSMSSDSMNWHDRMGHIGFDNMKTVINKELVIRIPKLIVEKQTCTSCLLGKQVRQSFPQSTSYRASNPLELVHGDLCGPITPPTTANKRYIFSLIDDFSRYMWTFLLKEKSEAFDKFKIFKVSVEQETRATLKTFRTYRGGEFVSLDFNTFCDVSGIKRHLTAPYSPQHNGVVERQNRTLLGMT